jgi:hypothetical protein
VKFGGNLRITDAQIEVVVAQIRAATEDDAPTNPPTFDDIGQALRTLQQPRPEDGRDLSATQRKRRAATIRREIAMRAEELRRAGVPSPVTQAEEEMAKWWQHTNGAALNKWLRRNR